MNKLKEAAATSYPPRSFDSCNKLDGTWYAAFTLKISCRRKSNGRNVKSFNNLRASKYFIQECAAYGVNTEGKEICERQAAYGQRRSLDAEPYMINQVELYEIRRDGTFDPTPRKSR